MLKDRIVKWLLDYSKTNDFKFVVGISGGIDSSVVSTLCALTGVETHVINIPIKQKEEQIVLADNHIKWLSNFKNVKTHKHDLTHCYESFKGELSEFNNPLGLANSRSRLRMMTLYQVASFVNGIVVGTGNKIEDFGVGFFTKYGDGGVDISPIADLTKTEVRELAKELNIIEDIILAKPTDGLWDDGRTDEEQLGATYEELEWAMDFKGDVNTLNDREKEVMLIYNFFNKKNQHKIKPIPVFKK